MFVAQTTLEQAWRYYDSAKNRLFRYGRDWDDLLIMPGLLPIVGRAEAEARTKHQALQDLIHALVVKGAAGDAGVRSHAA